MKAVKTCVAAAVFSLALTSSVFAKEMKIAFVDLAQLFDKYQKTKEYDASLQKKGEGFQKQRDDMIAKIQSAQGKLAVLKDDEKQKLQADIDKQKNELIEFDKDKRTELAKERDEKVREILLEIERIVSDIAKKEGYDYILNDRVLIYGDQTQNLTERVLKSLNDSYKK